MERLVAPDEVTARSMLNWMSVPRSVGKPADLGWPRGNYFPSPLSGSRICTWPNLGSVVFAYTIGMIGKTRKPMRTTKCVCAVTHIGKERVLTRARAERVPQEPAASEVSALRRSGLWA